MIADFVISYVNPDFDSVILAWCAITCRCFLALNVDYLFSPVVFYVIIFFF